MLHEFIAANRDELIMLCLEKAARRTAPRGMLTGLEHGVPLFIDQLAETLRLDEAAATAESVQLSGRSGGETPDYSDIGNSAAQHGSALQRQGFTVEQVVHEYGDLCQAVTELAMQRSAQVTVDEFHTLNRCMDNAIASAVTEFGRQRDSTIAEERVEADHRLGFFAHEVRNLLGSAILALAALKSGKVGFGGATSAVLDRSMLGLRLLIERTLEETRPSAGSPISPEVIPVSEFLAEMQVAASMEAQHRGCVFTVWPAEQSLAVEADRHMLSSAVTNLLQNAFKFTRPRSHVSLKACALGDRVLIEVADECGGLPPGKAEELFSPFTQRAGDRTGVGLGLSIAKRLIKMNRGTIQVRDVPGTGCIFTIDLPRHVRAAS